MIKTVDIQVPCSKCGSVVTVKLQAVPTLVNTENVSLAMWEHGQATTCFMCGSEVTPIIAQIESVKIIAAVKNPPPSRIITPSMVV